MSGQKEKKNFTQSLVKAGRVALDTSVFIYQLEAIEEYFPLTSIVFELITLGRILPVTSIVTVSEVLVKPFRQNDKAKVFLFQEVINKMSQLLVLPISWEISILAAQLRGKYDLRLPDAFQIAAGLSAGAKAFVTNDERLKKIKELQILCLSDFVH